MAAVTSVRADDWLLTPENAVITLIDYQPDQYAGVGSIGVDELLVNVITLGQIATAYGLPVVLSTVGMKLRGMAGTNQELHVALNNAPEIDRTTINSWEDPDFRAAIDGPQEAHRGRAVDRNLRRLPRSTPCAPVTTCTWSKTPSAASAPPRTTPPCAAWNRPAPGPSP